MMDWVGCVVWLLFFFYCISFCLDLFSFFTNKQFLMAYFHCMTLDIARNLQKSLFSIFWSIAAELVFSDTYSKLPLRSVTLFVGNCCKINAIGDIIYMVQVKIRRENIHAELSVSKELILWRSRQCGLEIGLRVKCGGLSGSLGSSHIIETYSWPIYSFLEHEIGNSFMVCLDRGIWSHQFQIHLMNFKSTHYLDVSRTLWFNHIYVSC